MSRQPASLSLLSGKELELDKFLPINEQYKDWILPATIRFQIRMKKIERQQKLIDALKN